MESFLNPSFGCMYTPPNLNKINKHNISANMLGLRLGRIGSSDRITKLTWLWAIMMPQIGQLSCAKTIKDGEVGQWDGCQQPL